MSHFASFLGVDRTSYYRKPEKRIQLDELAIQELQLAHIDHPHYGVRRLSLHMGWSINKTRRIRTLAGIVIARPSKRKRLGTSSTAEIPVPANALSKYAAFKNELRPQDGMDYSGMADSGGWVQDFTYLWFERSWHYLAVVMDLKTRQAVGWQLGLRHTSELTYRAVLDALSKHSPPTILHSDQGSEYLSFQHKLLCERMEITLSCSAKSSPWQNGFMERFFGNFKFDLGSLSRFKDIAELHEAIALNMHYYNTKRIHSALKMSPAVYANQLNLERDILLQKMGA